MNDDLDRRLRDALRTASLPVAPASLHDHIASLGDEPEMVRRRRGSRAWLLLVPIAALLGVVALAGGATLTSRRPLDTPSPQQTAPLSIAASALPASVDGLVVETVSELLAARAAGHASGGPFALRGYWTDRSFGHSCAAPSGRTGDLEIYCHDGEFGITERNELIVDFNFQTRRGTRASGPSLTPWIPSRDDRARLFTLWTSDGLRWGPVPIVVVGHFDDPGAADCRPIERQLCLDRFVIDRIVSFDPSSVPAPTPTPTPTPFPIVDPPPALFTSNQCYDGVPKRFAGWTTTNRLHTQVQRDGYVFAMITRDVIPIGTWYQNPNLKGHKTRLWGRGVCLSQEAGVMEFAEVTGSAFLEVDDGRHIAVPAP